MNETISALQSAIALNRKMINDYHELVSSHKSLAHFDKDSHLYWIRKDSAKIAQYARIQKMLKKQLAKEIRTVQIRSALTKAAKANYKGEQW